MTGFLVVAKPAGPTSFQVVDQIRRTAEARRAGHAGTLDPFATGVLVVLIGKGTRLARDLSVVGKEYRAIGRLGVETDTLDITGQVTGGSSAGGIDAAAVLRALEGFRGPILQVPPLFSAKRIGGRRLHQIAREGGDVVRKPVTVTIARLEMLSFAEGRFEIDVACSKGTYIRSLVADIGRVLGCGATTESLERTAVGPFRLEQAVDLEKLDSVQAVRAALLPLGAALPWLPPVVLSEGGVESARHGRSVARSDIKAPDHLEAGAQVALVDGAGNLVALARWEVGEEVAARPYKVFV